MDNMSDFTYGLMLLCVGMGGTLLTLGLLILAVQLLKRAFPYSETEEKGGKEKV
jgi:Na+-transporting methylmalonyl-CoA/oxaloacetate decarboxylase gamma subunit